MERSFKKEVDALRLGAGETFRGEGILAVTKALLQSGVSCRPSCTWWKKALSCPRQATPR
jgi:hypothetical protein